MNWWADFFDEQYRVLWAPVLDDERTRWELDGVRELLERHDVHSVLDVCGGDGRIARPLAAEGYALTVADYSLSMLSHGRAQAQGDALSWVRADARRLPFAPRYDAVLNLFTSFGFFATDAEHQAAMDAMASSLRPGGVLIMDLVHRDFAATAVAPQTYYELADGTVVTRRFDFDPIEGRTHERLRVFDAASGVTVRERNWSIRLFTATELARMLERAGLRPLAWFGDYDGDDFCAESARLLLLAERTGTASARPEDEMPTMHWTTILDQLVCPQTRAPLRLLEAGELERLRAAAAAGTLRCQSGRRLEALEQALSTADGATIYPVIDDIPHLVADDVLVVAEP